jgi:hypothetical protein
MLDILALSLRSAIRSLGFIVLPIAILAWFIGWIKDKIS